MIRYAVLTIAGVAALPAFAQEQQAGNAASTDTEATFQALIDKCDDVDALMLRARIRLQLPHTTDAAATQAQTMLDDGFAACGGGDLDGAKAMLTEALALAEAGATEVYATDAAATPEPAAVEQTDTEEKSPWWKIW
ncbi:MAG: hypothetical protein AAFY25_13250 [Pseudomonadota bacterium]